MNHHPSSILAIIPARGGSKGIPRKNIQPLAGKPLLAYTLDAATAASLVGRVIVSTDDDEITDVATRLGVEVVSRPEELAGDAATSESALLHVLDHLRDEEGYEPEIVVFLQATSPLRQAGDIDSAVSQLIEEGADSLFSAARTNGFAWRRDDEGVRSMSYDYRDRPRRQEIGDDFIENGSIYVFKPRVLRDMGNRLGGKIEIYEMDPLNSFQIDEQGDIDLMEQILCIASVSRPVPDLSSTRLLVLDFDGVMTDDRVTVRQDGLESVVCHRGDGFGIEQLSRIGIDTVVLSKETNPVVEARCAKLGVQCHKGFDDKLPKLEALAAERDLEPEGVVFVGNDVNDLECVRWAGTGVAVRGARPELLAAADWVTKRRGGEGAVREVCDAIMKQQSKGNA